MSGERSLADEAKRRGLIMVAVLGAWATGIVVRDVIHVFEDAHSSDQNPGISVPVEPTTNPSRQTPTSPAP